MTSSSAAPSPALFFFQQFLASPRMVGSIIPTSRATINALLAPVNWAQARCIVEYGPGTGCFTRALLQRSRPDAQIIAIETNPMFNDYLRQAIDDPRLHLVDGSAADIGAILADHGQSHADYVISGLPFSTLPDGLADNIMDETARVIRPGGAFLIYQYSAFVRPYLQARFDRVDQGRTYWNIPPACLYHAWRDPDGTGLNSPGPGEN